MTTRIKITCDTYEQYYKIDSIYNHYHPSYYMTLEDGYEGIYFDFKPSVVDKYIYLLTGDLKALIGNNFKIEELEIEDEDDDDDGG